MRKYIKSLIAGAVVAASLILVPTISQATTSSSAGCTNVPDPYSTSGKRYQMQKYFDVSFSRSGATGTATVTTKPGIKLCNDQPMVFQSFNMGPNWDRNNPDIVANFVSSLPQTMNSSTAFVFSKNATSKTVTVNTPDVCYGTQLDVYVGDQPIQAITARFQNEQREISGKIFQPNGSCVKDIQVCDLASNTIVTIREDQFDASKHSKNVDDCKMTSVCELATGRLVIIKESAFDSKRYSRNYDDCKKIKVCDLATYTIITIRETAFDATKHSKDIENCKVPVKIDVCELATKKVISINEKDFDSKKHSKNLDDCKEKPVMIEVCELASKKIIKIDEKNFDASKHSKNLDDCKEKPVKIEVCDLTTKKIITINEKDFDAKKHTKVLEDCSKVTVCDTTTKTVVTISKNDVTSNHTTDMTKCDTKICRIEDKTVVTVKDEEYRNNKALYTTDMSVCVEAPEVPELPHTGLDGAMTGIVGLGSLAAAGSYYLTTRRQQ